MSMNIFGASNNYSYLFQSMGTSSGLGNLSFLSDYKSIKNGSYGKLMRSYYSENAASSVSSIAKNKVSAQKSFVDKESAKKITNVQDATDKLKSKADALLDTGKKSVFNADTVNDDMYKAVSDYVSSYNSVINSVDNLNNDSVTNKAMNLAISTENNSKALAKIGITINEDSTLKLDKDTFMKADVASVKSLFQGAGSYAYRASAQASLVNFAADTLASKSNTYTASGSYGYNMNVGSLFNTYF